MKKELDCVRMKHEIQERILGETRAMSDGEKIEYYRRSARQSPFWEKFQAAPPARRSVRPGP